uniref:Putative secreted peptide n=1 Tax=Anopheles braziliensis TaxID=58242 RepID=A0A2M3ZWF7_9DIPT
MVLPIVLHLLPSAVHPAVGQRSHLDEAHAPRGAGGLLQQSGRVHPEAGSLRALGLPKVSPRVRTRRHTAPLRVFLWKRAGSGATSLADTALVWRTVR